MMQDTFWWMFIHNFEVSDTLGCQGTDFWLTKKLGAFFTHIHEVLLIMCHKCQCVCVSFIEGPRGG